MYRVFSFVLLISIYSAGYSQVAKTALKDTTKSHKVDTAALNRLVKKYYTPEYLDFKKKIQSDFKNNKPGKFGQFIKGIELSLQTSDSVIAFTFDACGGKSGSGYNAQLIDYLRQERIPATLFVTGTWIKSNKRTFLKLASDSLFEIGNHGLLHRLCSVNGRSKYGVIATKNIGEVIDEMELCSREIEKLTNKRPRYFRSATAYTDETCVKVAQQLGMKIINYDVLSGDAIKGSSADSIANNILKNAKPGAIVIMHFNQPKRQEKRALEIAIPKLRELGYKFVLLNQYDINLDKKENKANPKP